MKQQSTQKYIDYLVIVIMMIMIFLFLALIIKGLILSTIDRVSKINNMDCLYVYQIKNQSNLSLPQRFKGNNCTQACIQAYDNITKYSYFACEKVIK